MKSGKNAQVDVTLSRRGKETSLLSHRGQETSPLSRRGQGLPIQVIVIMIIGLIALAVLLLYLFGVIGKGVSISDLFFGMGHNITKNASEEAGTLAG